MQTTIQKWGNSLALRIPRTVAADLGLKTESQVDLRIHNGVLEVVPITEANEALKALLDGITRENLHEPLDMGGAVGREEW